MTKSAAEYRFGLADKKLAARIGITTRSGDSPKTFQDTILAPRQLANLGDHEIPRYWQHDPVHVLPDFRGTAVHRLCGRGIFASHLMDSLLDLNIKGLPDSEYVFLNADTGVYLYHKGEAQLNTEAADAGYQEIIRRVREEGSTQAGIYSYRDENGDNELVDKATGYAPRRSKTPTPSSTTAFSPSRF